MVRWLSLNQFIMKLSANLSTVLKKLKPQNISKWRRLPTVRWQSYSWDIWEGEALTLSKEKKADLILIDEKKARKAARRAGFEVVGVLGLLLAAKNTALIPAVRPFIEELSKQGFRLSKKVTERALKEAGE